METNQHQPQLILVMGVAATGKTTVGRQLAQRLGYTFLDADDFHNSESVNLMRSGLPLSDALRDAWVERLLEALASGYQQVASYVLAFSGLRAKHRRRLMQADFQTRAFMLQGKPEVLLERLGRRQNHFMPATQLQDQLMSMQPIEADEQIEVIDIEPSVETLVNLLENRVKGKPVA